MGFLELLYALYVSYWRKEFPNRRLQSFMEFRARMYQLSLPDETTTKSLDEMAAPKLDEMAAPKTVSLPSNVSFS